jgi:hypothetical protein
MFDIDFSFDLFFVLCLVYLTYRNIKLETDFHIHKEETRAKMDIFKKVLFKNWENKKDE